MSHLEKNSNSDPNKDTLQRFLFESTPIRGEFIRLEKSFQAIHDQHAYPPLLRRLLGEALCVAGLLSSMIKFKGRVTMQFQGKGHLKLLLAQCNDQFHLRGLIKWEGPPDFSNQDLIAAFQEGTLVIMLESGKNEVRYQGVVAWHGESLAESIEGYFQHSEQLATKLWLAVNDTSAAGLLLQVIPSSEREVTSLEKETTQLHWQRMVQLTSVLQPAQLLHINNYALLQQLYPQEEIRLFPDVSVVFRCTCTLKRSENAIVLLGQPEAEDELKKHQKIVVTCEFCNKEYIFDRVDVARIFAEQNNVGPPSDIH